MEEDFNDKYWAKAASDWLKFERRQILKCMFSRYKSNREFCDIENPVLYFLIWLKSLICILLNWRRAFDFNDNTVVVCTTDEEEGYDALSWIACEAHRSPFVWCVSIYIDGN